MSLTVKGLQTKTNILRGSPVQHGSVGGKPGWSPYVPAISPAMQPAPFAAISPFHTCHQCKLRISWQLGDAHKPSSHQQTEWSLPFFPHRPHSRQYKGSSRFKTQRKSRGRKKQSRPSSHQGHRISEDHVLQEPSLCSFLSQPHCPSPTAMGRGGGGAYMSTCITDVHGSVPRSHAT